MICRRCGAEIPDNSIRCKSCGIKVNMYCPECKTLNPFGEKYCVNCGSELLLTCSVCGSTNIYYANDCRKCHSPLIKGTKSPEKRAKDIPVVESFSAEESAYASNIDPSIRVTANIDDGLPTVEKIQPDYVEEEVSHIFGQDEEFVEIAQQNNQQNEQASEKTTYSQIPFIKSMEETESDEFQEPLIIDEVIELEEHNNDELLETPLIENSEQTEQKTQEDTTSINNESEKAEKSQEQPQEISEKRIEAHPDIVKKITNTIKNSLQKHIIAINGPEGCGKSDILKQISNNLLSDGYLSLYGSCTPLVQITSFGFFQDAFLRIMGFPTYTKSSEDFIENFRNSDFAKVFSFLDESDLDLFLNIFYPFQEDNFENIINNKMRIFSILEKVIKSFLVSSNLIILIDNFELLDGASYDFLVHMLKNGFFNNRLKLIVAYQENKDIKSYFELSKDEEKIFETVEINKYSREELLEAIKNITDIPLSEVLDTDSVDALIEKADGNVVKIMQETAFMLDTGYLSIKDNEIFVNENCQKPTRYNAFDEVVKKRINTLAPIARNVLFMAAIMGYRFAKNILCLAVTIPIEKAQETIDFLAQNLYVRKVDNYTYEFKSLNLWKLIYKEAKEDLLYKENAQRLYQSLKPLVLSSNVQKLISCKTALSVYEEFDIWQNTASLTAKLGDTNLYVISLKQCLKLIEENNFENSDEVKQIIYEEMGKLLYEKSPNEAITYLANVLDEYIKNEDVKKVIDVSSYFVKSCYLTGNYFGAAEAVDSILSIIKKSGAEVSALEIALIKTRKLNALLNIGHCEQIINLVEDEIIPELDKNLAANLFEADYKNIVLNGWYNSKIILAKAYIIQGNSKANDVIEEIDNAISKHNYNPSYYKLYVGIVKALLKTVLGEIHKSNEILNNMSLSFKTGITEPHLLVWWNLINIINRVLMHQTKDLKVDLFELAAFANNINEHFIKNLVKLVLGYIFKIEGNKEKAEEIYNEQIVYFAKEKAAMGALLAWAFLCRQFIDKGDEEKAFNTANKSLEIAQSPKINNYMFIIYFQKFLAEIYSLKHDYTSTKMYLEKSIIIAKQFNLRYQLIELYLTYAKYLQDFMKYKKIYSNDNLTVVCEMYKNAIALAKELSLNYLSEYGAKEYSTFRTFCQLNNIDL